MMTLTARLKKWRFGSLKSRIATVYGLLFAGIFATVLLVAGNGIERFAEKTIASDMQSNARVFDEVIQQRARQMRRSADVLAADFGFRESVALGDAATIESALVNARARAKLPDAFVVMFDGNVIGHTPALSDKESRDLWNALDSGDSRGIIADGRGVALAVAAPVNAPDLIGWLVLSQPLSAAELKRLGALAAIPLDAKVVPAAQMKAGLPRNDAAKDMLVERSENGERILYRVSELPELGTTLAPRLVLRYSLTSALQNYAVLGWILLSLGLVGLVVTLLAGWRIASGITRPLALLDDAAQRFSAGENVAVSIRSNDEVGRLATSFNAMVVAINEREQRITHMALHDALTGLPNRKLFREQLDFALARLHKDERLVVAYVDLDNFKLVNDTLGHPAGDSLLRDVSLRLTNAFEEATVARLGGDEFALMFPRVASDVDVGGIAERVAAAFTGETRIEGQTFATGASIGLAVAPADGLDGEQIIKNADLALYRAKQEGRGCYQFFEAGMDEQARQRRQLEMDMRQALATGQFQLHFQPLYNIAEQRLLGFEALIRWEHPTRGMVPPIKFIPLAEETGLIIPIGEWVVREACRQAATWPEPLRVAVNISPLQFRSSNLTTAIFQALAQSRLEPSRLELEITESIFIDNVEATLSALHGLRNLGVRIALDDFGTGYSSLSYLRSFPFDKVKIDQSFVHDLGSGAGAKAIIRAITTLAAALGMETLAEGVEDADQVEMLRIEGCEQIQGYWLSRPIPAIDVQAMIVRLETTARKVA